MSTKIKMFEDYVESKDDSNDFIPSEILDIKNYPVVAIVSKPDGGWNGAKPSRKNDWQSTTIDVIKDTLLNEENMTVIVIDLQNTKPDDFESFNLSDTDAIIFDKIEQASNDTVKEVEKLILGTPKSPAFLKEIFPKYEKPPIYIIMLKNTTDISKMLLNRCKIINL